MRLALAALIGTFAVLLHAEDLPRRADLGASIAHPMGGQPATIRRFRPNSVLEQAGLRVGDALLAIDGKPIETAADLDAVRKLKGGSRVVVRWRSTQRAVQETTVTVPAMALESRPGLDIRYRDATTDRGWRVRTYVSRPAGAQGRLALVVFGPWLSCDAVEVPFPTHDGWQSMLGEVMSSAGVQLVRIEKPGVGDSEGPPCADSDLEDDLAGFRAGIRQALGDPAIDPARFVLMGGSVGGALVAPLASEFKPSAIVALGGFSRTWYEHMIEIERRRLTLSGTEPSAVNAAMKGYAGLYDEVLNGGATPAQAIARHPAWKALWDDEPARQYGRPIRYYQQLQALDVEGAWSRVAVPVLVLHGEYDWIMSAREGERVGEILAGRPGVSVVLRPRMNHHFDRFADPVKAFREDGGEYDAEAGRLIARWIREHVAR
jgi:pimeloyl-ACP methyl ester carboxylesterase